MRRNVAVRQKEEFHDADVSLSVPQQAASRAVTGAFVHDMSTGHLCDLPPSIHKLTMTVWGFFFLVLWATFWPSSNALFMVAMATVYGIVFFGLPTIMARFHPHRPKHGQSVRAFLSSRFETLYGPVSGTDALLQVLIVPASLAVGAFAIGLIITWARHAS